MAEGDIISAARYNTIQGRIAALLGPGSGDRGYNNAVSSSAVTVGTDNGVTIEDMDNLQTDYTKIYVHQTGSLPGGLIGQNVSTRLKGGFDSYDTGLVWDDLFAEYETQLAVIEANRFKVDVSQVAVESGLIDSSRSTVWGGSALPQSVTHEFTASFSSENARRGFFNAGGEIRFTASLTHSLAISDPDYQKTQDWSNMLSNMKTIKFTYTSTNSYDLNYNPLGDTETADGEDVSDDTITGSGTGTAIGNLDLTSSYQTIYSKTGSGVYSDNVYSIKAKLDNSSTIRFLITFDDGDVGVGGADERVNGTLVSSVSHLRSDSTSYVSNPKPSYSKTSDL